VLNGILQKGGRPEYVSTPLKWIETLQNEKLILRPMAKSIHDRALSMLCDSNTVFQVNRDMILWAQTNYRKEIKSRPTTGMFAIKTFLSLGRTVHLYGFDFYDCKGPVHYWESWTVEKWNATSHDFSEERDWVLSQPNVVLH